MACLTCGAPMGAGAVMCGRCGTEHAVPEPEGDRPSPGAAGRENRAEGGGGISALPVYGVIALIALAVTGGVGGLWWNHVQQGKQARTMAEMRHVADLLEQYHGRYHHYPRATSPADLELQLKGLAQQQVNARWLPKLNLNVDLPLAPPEAPLETTPASIPDAAAPASKPPSGSAPARPTGEIDPLNRSLGRQLPERPCVPPRDALTGEPVYGGDYEAKCPGDMRAGEPPQRVRSRGAGEAVPGLPQEAPDGPLAAVEAPVILGKLDFARIPQRDNWGNEYRYFPFGEDYVLVSAGSDGRFEHPDPSRYVPKDHRRISQDLVIRSGKWIQAPEDAP